MRAYYNEHDPFAAEWLRNLIAAGLIAPGEVDERSIEDVYPSDLRGFVQCHFFAGIGVWSYALRLAGWPDERPIWTGSCPCQPFSAAGKRGGTTDERHLWPAFFHLIDALRPPVVLGEQVASKAADDWIDLVQADVEAVGYAFGCVPFPAASVGAPHIRDRNYWLAIASQQQQHGSGHAGPGRRVEHSVRRVVGGLDDSSSPRHFAAGRRAEREARDETRLRLLGSGRDAERLAYHHHQGLEGRAGESERPEERAVGSRELAGRLADSNGGDACAEGLQRSGEYRQQPQDGGALRLADDQSLGWFGGPNDGNEGRGQRASRLEGETCERPGPVNGFWRDADWLCCRDGKWRPVESGTFPLAHGAPSRVGRLRAYGNAIVARQAQVFIEAAADALIYRELMA